MSLGVGKLVAGDCVHALKSLPDKCTDLVFADPPFNIGYSYDICKDKWGRNEYLFWIDQWLPQLVRILKPNGSLWLMMGDEHVADYKNKLDSTGLKLVNWIIWHYTFARLTKRKFARSHQHILYYVVDKDNYKFNYQDICVPTVVIKYVRESKHKVRIPNDVWCLHPNESEHLFQPDHDVWFYKCVTGFCNKERVDHPSQTPESLIERIIKVATNPGDLVVDPFAGSGTTLVVAKRLGRNYWGCELSPRYAKVILDRLAKQGGDDTEVVFLNPHDRQQVLDQNEQLPAEHVKSD
jgi:site-specific DNA-methyltransferase (adenine-specific)